jgi:hypothetical protein
MRAARPTTRLLLLPALLAALAGGCDTGDDGNGGDGPARVPAAAEIGENVVRVGGKSGHDVAAEAVLAAYPPDGERQPNGWVIAAGDDWRLAVLGAQFGAKPIQAGLLSAETKFVPTPTHDVLQRVRAKGFPRGKGVDTIVLGRTGRDVGRTLSELDLEQTQFPVRDPASTALELVPFRGGFAHGYSSEVMVVSSEQREYALPAAAWSAYTGDSIAFTARDAVPEATRKLLVQRKKLRAAPPTIYLVGPRSVISAGVEADLSQYGRVERIAGGDAVETAVAFARYRDPETGFGWGLEKGPASVSLVNLRDWDNAVGAFNFAATSAQAPLLLTTRSDRLPPAVAEYVASLRGPRANQGFVFGDERSISRSALGELDRALARR